MGIGPARLIDEAGARGTPPRLTRGVDAAIVDPTVRILGVPTDPGRGRPNLPTGGGAFSPESYSFFKRGDER